MLRLVTLAGIGFTIVSSSAMAQLPSPNRDPLVGARSLALNPDGSKLAFSYQGDIWVVSASGGRAVPVTNHIEMDDNPIWSPDGEWIAFSSNRFGNHDIFVVPSEGGKTQRLTWHSGSDVPSDWSRDGKTILFRATRDEAVNGIFGIDVATGRTRQYLLDYMSVGSPKFSVDQKEILYTRIGFPWTRPRYQGSAASQLWQVNIASGKRTEWRNNGFQHLWPHFALGGKSILTVTVNERTPSSSYVRRPIPKNIDSVERCPNLYAVDAPGKARRLTDFTEEGVRFLSVAANGKVASFERDGDVYVLALGEQPKKIAITATFDDKQTNEERLTLRDGVIEQTVSPKGDRVVFNVRGELWMIPVKKGKGPNADDAKQLTTWEGFDKEPLFANENTVFFTSDRHGSNRLFKLNVDSLAVTPITTDDADVGALSLTPDRKSVAFWKAGKSGGLYMVPIEGGIPKLILSRPGNSDGGSAPQYSFSPDGRFVAYPEVLRRSGYYYWEASSNIWIADVQSGEKRNVTRLSSNHSSPQWSPDGKYLYFTSNRQGTGIFVLPLTAEDARDTELDLKFVKPTSPVRVEIDFEGIELRTRRLVTTGPVNNIRFDANNGDLYYLLDGDINKTDYNGENPRKMTAGGEIGSFEFTADGNFLEFTKGGAIQTLNLRAPGNPVSVTTFRADWRRDVRKERSAAYEQFWRSYNRNFYDANFHGRDWLKLKSWYAKLLPSVGHRNEMATVLNMLVGNLEASHTEVSAGVGNPNGESSAHLGFTFDYSYSGPGLKIKDVPSRSPGSYTKTKLSPGDVVQKVNGKDVNTDESLYRDVLNEQIGRDFVLTVRNATGQREVKYRALSGGEFSGIVNSNRLQWRRSYVEAKSGGKVGYVHIAGMSGPELDRFNQQVWEFGEGKKALIIDVRGNGGGNTSDRIIDVLERLPNSIYQGRDEEPQLGPGQALAMPMVVMAAENSFSNAEMFPYAMRERKLAKLVGTTTPGYVIYTGGLPLVDGTIARMPGTGVFRLDGSPLENMGQKMDFEVQMSPEDFFANRDPQLDKAIEVLMKQAK